MTTSDEMRNNILIILKESEENKKRVFSHNMYEYLRDVCDKIRNERIGLTHAHSAFYGLYNTLFL